MNIFEKFTANTKRLAGELRKLGEIVPIADRENMRLYSRMFGEIAESVDEKLRGQKPGLKAECKRFLNLFADLHGSLFNWRLLWGHNRYMATQLTYVGNCAGRARTACQDIITLIHQKVKG